MAGRKPRQRRGGKVGGGERVRMRSWRPGGGGWKGLRSLAGKGRRQRGEGVLGGLIFFFVCKENAFMVARLFLTIVSLSEHEGVTFSGCISLHLCCLPCSRF